MMCRRAGIAPIALAFMILLISACGDSEEITSTPTPPTTQTPGDTVAPSAVPTVSPSPAASPTSTPVPTPTTTPTPTPTMPTGTAGRELAYIGSDGGIWLVRADGSGLAHLATGPCGGGRGEPTGLTWSPNGDKLALLCFSPGPSPGILVVLDASGDNLTTVSGTDRFRWAPDGERLAYQTGASPGSIESAQVRMLNLNTLEDSLIAEDAWLIDWSLPDRPLLGLNLTPGDLHIVKTYEANWYDLASGETERVQRLDNHAHFWMATGGERAVVLAALTDGEQPGAALAIYDFDTGAERRIEGSTISYPSESIPARRLAISPDGTELYWADDDDAAGDPIYRANMDGTGLVLVGRTLGGERSLSGDGLVVYRPYDNRPSCVILDLESTASVEIDACKYPVWRPAP